MNDKNKNSGLFVFVLIACIVTAGLFAVGNTWAYKDHKKSLIANQNNTNVEPSPNDYPIVVESSGEIVDPNVSKKSDNSVGTTSAISSTSEESENSKYANNSLATGATPYAKYYGGNKKCNEYGCSKIKVTTSNSDVLVTIKKNGRVVRHAYIKAGGNYTFSFPNGTYQAFFYYGSGWNPKKPMKGGEISGGFVNNESFGKDDPQTLSNNILEYSLVLQEYGNFSTRPSDSDEAL